MIKLPKGTPVHKELSSSFVNLGNLVKELKNTGFSGLVELVGVQNEAFLLIEFGNIIDVHILGEDRRSGRHHLDTISALAKAENMLISTFQMPPEAAVLLSTFLNSEKIHENLSSDFTDPNRLISKFANEDGEFFVEVIFQKNLGTGLLFIQEGEIVDALLSLLGKSLTQGDAAVTGVIEGATELGATFNVYRADIETGVLNRQGTDVPVSELNSIFSVLLSLFQEKLEDSSRNKLEFGSFLRESCLAMADKFPFLDPFAAEFSYAEGRVELFADETPEKIAEGVVGMIQHMLNLLVERDIPFDRELYLSDVMEHLESGHKEAVFQLKLATLLNKLN